MRPLRHGDGPELRPRRAPGRGRRLPHPRLRASRERGERGRRALFRQRENPDRNRPPGTHDESAR